MITYEHEQYLTDAINGVLMQECDFGVELIIADDCSPDCTKEIVEGFRNHRNYHWIKYTRHSENKGVMANFVWALKQAKGKYIALCEGDDFWIEPLKLNKQVSFLSQNLEYSITTSNSWIVEGNNTRQFEFPINSFNALGRKKQYSKLLLSKSWLPILNILFVNRKSVIEGIQLNPSNLYGDFQIIFNNLKIGKFYYFSEIMGVYRIHDRGISRISTEVENRNFEHAVFIYKFKKALSEFLIIAVIKLFFNYFFNNHEGIVGYRLRKKILKWSSE